MPLGARAAKSTTARMTAKTDVMRCMVAAARGRGGGAARATAEGAGRQPLDAFSAARLQTGASAGFSMVARAAATCKIGEIGTDAARGLA